MTTASTTRWSVAQDFSTRYRFVDSQADDNSVDGDPAAAYRGRLSRVAVELVADLDRPRNEDGLSGDPLNPS